METSLNALKNSKVEMKWRRGVQPIMPDQMSKRATDQYDIYPYHGLGGNKIYRGYGSLAKWMVEQKTVVIDGYVGVFWNHVQAQLQSIFDKENVSVNWVLMTNLLKPSAAIEEMVQPFLGAQDAVWGRKCNLTLSDFFELNQSPEPIHTHEINIVIGTGAALLGWQAPIVYLDLPKNELQLRMRAGATGNLGTQKVDTATNMYKRFYFVDWVVLNAHKKAISNDVAVLADSQWKDTLHWAFAQDIKMALQQMSQSVFRVRPWFEPGAWGGQWMKERIPGLSQDHVNLAWSFEMIVPENGLVFESDGALLEISFDFLMFQQHEAVLGKHASLFGYEFPIRFDFLDTWDGGNLSIQCHPSLPYIREHFGETITQDETYYMLDCQSGAEVYLGFQEDINPAAFKYILEESQTQKKEVAIDQYVQVHQAEKHELFLIPNGTVHSAGAGSLVLEISATPYIFTFKMYDWLRLDLNGEPRAINIEHAFKNLNFERKGDRVKEELISKPHLVKAGQDWQIVHLPTHQQHFYDIERLEFDTYIEVDTADTVHILMLVEGTSVDVQTADGTAAHFHYAETFVIPAAAQRYTLTNTGNGRAKVIKAFVKEDAEKLIK